MKVTIHAQQYEMTPELRRYALETLHEPLTRIWDKEGSELEIILRDLRGTKGGIDKECRCIFYMPNGPKFVITEVTEDMRKSIHQCRKRLMRRTRAYVGQKIHGNRWPKKHYVAKYAPKELLGATLPQAVPGGSER